MNRTPLLIPVLLTSSISGCLQDESLAHDDQEEASFPGSLGFHPRMTGCESTDTFRYFTAQTHPIPGPDEWEEEDAHALPSVLLEHFRCEYVEWGPFSRGPVTFVLESHQNYDLPENCETFASLTQLLISVGIDDEEIVGHAQERFNLPAYYTAITPEKTEIDGQKSWRWDWGPEEPKSWLEFPAADSQIPEYSEQDIERFYWGNGSSVSAWDMVHKNVTRAIEIPTAHGILQPPMAIAEAGMKEWAGQGGLRFVPEIESTITEFQDWQCTPKDDPASQNGNNTSDRPTVYKALLIPSDNDWW